MIKGNVEKDIRAAYFGGNCDVFINELNNGYYYDMNSQYPFAMLEDMPVGNPTFSTDTNLFNYFGFVYGTVTAPSKEDLNITYIQMRDENSGNVSCPRGQFKRMIFSEEIKAALLDGYKFDVEFGYKFEKGKDLFKEFILEHYNNKKNAKDSITRGLAKLMLNSLYGKFGMKDVYSKMKIVSKKESNKIIKNYNYSVFAELSDDKVLIKYSSRINEQLRKLFKSQEDMNKNDFKDAGLQQKRGVPSAVHIAAAISAYARISINKFKNIPGNPCIMSDTDSVVLPKMLSSEFVGKEIGQMKLEHKFKKGIFIRKKLYALITNEDKQIIKASGAKAKYLNFNDFISLLNGNDVLTPT
jgi:hypothetical protein